MVFRLDQVIGLEIPLLMNSGAISAASVYKRLPLLCNGLRSLILIIPVVV